MDSLEWYHVEEILDAILSSYDKDSFDTQTCPIYQKLETEKYRIPILNGGLKLYDAHTSFTEFRLVATYLKMPQQEIEKYYNELVSYAKETGSKHLDDIEKHKDLFLYGFEGENVIETVGLPSLEVLGVNLPWINELSLEQDSVHKEADTR